MLLRNPARIEALFCAQFLALLLGALIEREIRTAMKTARTHNVPLYPELRACPTSLHRAHPRDLRRPDPPRAPPARTPRPEPRTRDQPTPQQVLDLLGVPTHNYTLIRPN